MGCRGRTSTLLIGITDDDNDILSSYATKGDASTDVDLTTTTLLSTGPRREGDNPTRRRSPVSTTMFSRSVENPNRRKKDARSLFHGYVACSSERQRDIEEEWHAADRANRRQPARTKEAYFSKDENDQCGHWKSRPKKHRSNEEDNLS
ncbi:hypothetical protein Tco_0596335 [Tanacetum coccineum]